MKKELIKIAVVGPESTGKSTLSSALAKHYQTVWVPEYARYYCEGLTAPCTLQDELNMFYGQVALEKSMEVVAQNNLLICDTTFLTVKIWSDHQLGETPQPVLEAIKTTHYDFYVLLKNDLPWEDDPLRDFKGMGDHFMEVWRKELNAINANFKEVGGIENRLENAIVAIDEFLSSKKL
ncbi:ATP-binding protein [Pelobium sp.]|nr:ATP-binding protein [Pelobium sp.]MDA9554935.1 ATP-binding protein [Pelobium sp.]